MRFRIIVLLAVCCDIAAAGPLRHNGARVQHYNVPRFLNHTEIPSISAAIPISTPIPISSSSITPLIAVSSETSAFAITSSIIAAATPLLSDVVISSSLSTKSLSTSTPSELQLASSILPSTIPTTAVSEPSDAGNGVAPISTSAPLYSGSPTSESQQSAVVQPAETLSRLFNLASSPPDDLQPSTTAPSSTSTPSSSIASSTPATFSVQSKSHILEAASTSSSPLVLNQAAFSSETPKSSSSSAAPAQVSSSSVISMTSSYLAAASQTQSSVVVPVPISSGLVQVLGAGGDTADEFAPVTLDASSPAPTGTAKYPIAEGGNTAMANGYNDVYKTLNEDTPCNPGDPSQAYVCVLGEMAECQSGGTYVLKSCPRGQSCYALPKPTGLTGVVVQCAVPSMAASILAGLPSSTTVPVAVTSQPALMLQAEGDSSQTTQSVTAQNPVQSVTSSTFQSQTMTLAPSVLAVATTASQDQDSDQVDASAVSPGTSTTSAPSSSQTQSRALNPSVTVVTATAHQVQNSNTLSDAPESEATSLASSTTAAVLSVPKALFGIVTANVNDRAMPSENSAQASTPTSRTSQSYPEISTPVVQSSSQSPTGNPDSLQPTEASMTSTSTTSADNAGITTAPMGPQVNEKVGAGNGQATVTVTVTVTTTEKPAPVTIISS